MIKFISLILLMMDGNVAGLLYNKTPIDTLEKCNTYNSEQLAEHKAEFPEGVIVKATCLPVKID